MGEHPNTQVADKTSKYPQKVNHAETLLNSLEVLFLQYPTVILKYNDPHHKSSMRKRFNHLKRKHKICF